MKRGSSLQIVAAFTLFASPWPSADAGPELVPNTTFAAAMDQGGGPDVLTIHRLPVPKVNPGEILIAVHATGVNVWEQEHREHPRDVHFPVVLGSDGSGNVAAVGSGAQGFKVGDDVYAISGGFYAEYVSVRAGDVGTRGR